MKNRTLPFLVVALCAAASACGGSSNNSSVDPAYAAATPSYDLVALSVDDSDAAAPSATAVSSELVLAGASSDLGSDPCHPHLFSRTRQVVLNLNILSYKLLSHVADVIANSGAQAVGTTDTWSHVGAGGIERQFSLTKNGDGSFSFELQFAPAGSTSFVTVFSGSLVHTAASAATSTSAAVLAETKGSMMFDYTALGSVVTSDKETGQISYEFDVVTDPTKPGRGVKRDETINFANFMFGPNDPHGARNGSYVFVGERGNGGTLAYQDSLALLCPANPSGLDANTVTEARWYLDSTDGLIHGRADAKATQGQIPSGDTWLGVTCHQGPAPTPANEDAYWMMKEEDASGATVQGSAHQVSDASAAPCDPALGATVPALGNDSTDWTFGGPLTFPNEW